MINKKDLTKKLYKGYTQKQVASFYKVHIGTIEKYVKLYGLKGIKKKKGIKTLSFSDPYFCYFIGLFLTDGYYNPKTEIIEITLKDKIILKLLAHKLGLTFKEYNGTYRIYSSRAWSKKFTEVTNIQSGAKTYTANLLGINLKPLQEYFIIRGMIDGDGTIRKSGQIRFFSCSKNLISMFSKFLEKKNFEHSIIDQKPGKVITIVEKSRLEFAVYIYRLLPELAIRRKRKIVNKLVDDIVRTYEIVNRKKWYN